MTTSDLGYRLENYRFFRSGKATFNIGEMYIPANDAQREICTELKALESSCYLALVALQEQYSHSAIAIASSTAVNPSVVTTSSAHGLTTGDSVIINSHLVNTAINGSNRVTVINTTSFSVPVLGNGTGGATGSVYHSIMQAFEVKSAKKTGTDYGVLLKSSKDDVDARRSDYGVSSETELVNRFYEIWDSTYTFGVQGIPSASGVILLLNFYRLPLSFQEISSSVNPVLSSMYDRCLYLGTLKYYLENLDYDEKVKVEYYTEAITLFEKEKERLRQILAVQRMPKPQERPRFRW